MIQLKSKMTKKEIEQAEAENARRRKRALQDYHVGKIKIQDAVHILNACDDMAQELARRKKAAK